MNKITITNCRKCSWCIHNNQEQLKDTKWICCFNNLHQVAMLKGWIKKEEFSVINGIDCWYGLPILAKYNSKSGKQINIPNWCPRLEK